MSKAARKRAEERVRRHLFGDGLVKAPVPQPSERETLLRRAQELRKLAVRGMKPRAYIKQAEQLERQAG